MTKRCKTHTLQDEIEKAVQAKFVLSCKRGNSILTIHFAPTIPIKTISQAYTYFNIQFKHEIIDMYYVGSHAIRFYLYDK